MDAFLFNALHNGSLWLIVACLGVFFGVVAGLYTRSGSEIDAHPYARAADGDRVGTDMPVQASGREELEALLEPRRAGRRFRRER